jgi:RsiW-degrading membrane proteinase PrsW (M82 family)
MYYDAHYTSLGEKIVLTIVVLLFISLLLALFFAFGHISSVLPPDAWRQTIWFGPVEHLIKCEIEQQETEKQK